MQKKLHKFTGDSLHLSLREKCPNAELVRIQENRDKKKTTPYLSTFHAVFLQLLKMLNNKQNLLSTSTLVSVIKR